MHSQAPLFHVKPKAANIYTGARGAGKPANSVARWNDVNGEI